MKKRKIIVLITVGLLIGLLVNLYVRYSPVNAMEKLILSEVNSFSEYINELVQSGDPIALSSNPYDYIHHESFDHIVDLGIEAVPTIEKIVSESQNDGLEEYMLVLAAQKILGVELHTVLDKTYTFSTAKEWCDQYNYFKNDLKDNVDYLISENRINEIIDLGIIAIPYLYELSTEKKIELNNVISAIANNTGMPYVQEMTESDIKDMADNILSELKLEW